MEAQIKILVLFNLKPGRGQGVKRMERKKNKDETRRDETESRACPSINDLTDPTARAHHQSTALPRRQAGSQSQSQPGKHCSSHCTHHLLPTQREDDTTRQINPDVVQLAASTSLSPPACALPRELVPDGELRRRGGERRDQPFLQCPQFLRYCNLSFLVTD